VVNGQDARYASTFVDVAPGDLLLYEDAYRVRSLAVNRGSAAERLGLDLDAEVRIAAPGGDAGRLGTPRLHSARHGLDERPRA
jgi:hypothetical protein